MQKPVDLEKIKIEVPKTIGNKNKILPELSLSTKISDNIIIKTVSNS